MERQVYSTRRENRKYALDLPVSLMGRMDCDPVLSRSIFRKKGEEETEDGGKMKSMARFRSAFPDRCVEGNLGKNGICGMD